MYSSSESGTCDIEHIVESENDLQCDIRLHHSPNVGENKAPEQTSLKGIVLNNGFITAL